MRISTIAALMIVTTVLLAGCAQDQRAELDDRSHNFYARSEILPAYLPDHPASGHASNVAQHISRPAASAASVPVVVSQESTKPKALATVAVLSAATKQADAWQWPVDGKVIENFGKQSDGIANEGITIEAADGTPIHAASGGEVAFVGSNIRDYGNMVIVRHANGEMTSYAHAREILVEKGAKVTAGTVLGYVGTSGGAKTPQLHFALREGSTTIDPLSKLPRQLAAN